MSGFESHQRLAPDGSAMCLADDELRSRGMRLVNGWWVRPRPRIA